MSATMSPNLCPKLTSELAHKTGLTNDIIAKLSKVFFRYKSINVVIIYGSRAKGNYRVGSDIDLTIKGSRLTFKELMQLENEIDDLLLPYSMDLSQYDEIENSALVEHIDRVGIVFYDGAKFFSCSETV